MKYTYEDLIRFWSKVSIKGEEECWEWNKSLNNKGYGVFSSVTPIRDIRIGKSWKVLQARVRVSV